ncbi:MAG: tRNA (adenosine(37)-N6)-dimethylallyltransferase MiaA [Elusimicrobia bacterium]|nr:tRNA (adenosine(37)-N6)-dimethylallyltransferase MiaA [Elusimicrobiota bacterium]
MTVLVVVGPTASGKTGLAIALARSLGGEVVSADSRQLYRGFDAGTAKPCFGPDGLAADPEAAGGGAVEAGGGVPYHLIDAADPSETVSAGAYARLAGPVLDAIIGRGRVPIVAGGTGLYIRALFEGLSGLPEADSGVRAELSAEADLQGLGSLAKRLSEVDPEAAARIPANNRQRIIRALEVHRLTGRPISSFWRQGTAVPEGRRPVYLSIVWPAEALRERISLRAAAMWPGILAEVRQLLERWTGREPAFQSLGYREALDCLAGRVTSEQGLALTVRATLAYAKRQKTWFNRQTPGAVRIEGGPTGSMLDAALQALPFSARPA